MTYSVYNPATRRYDYYETADPAPTHASAPRAVPKRALGATPEEAAHRLPALARKVGSGALPKGRVASTSALGGGALGDVADTMKKHPLLSAAAGAVAYLLWMIR